MSEPAPRQLPPVDTLTQPWWDATREQRLLLQKCLDCGHLQHYPRALCLSCRSTDLGWSETAGAGVVHSFTVVHRAPDPSFTPPYVVALVRLDEGPTLLTNLVGAGPDPDGHLTCDQRVSLAWQQLDDGRNLPVFTPTETHRE